MLTGRTMCLTQQEDKQCTFKKKKKYSFLYTQHFNVKMFCFVFLTQILADYEQKQNIRCIKCMYVRIDGDKLKGNIFSCWTTRSKQSSSGAPLRTF